MSMELPDNMLGNFIKVDNKVYTLNLVGEGVDIEARVKDYLTRRMERIANAEVDDIEGQYRQMHDHIERHKQRLNKHHLTIPDELHIGHDSLIGVYDNTIYATRAFLYNPSSVRTCFSELSYFYQPDTNPLSAHREGTYTIYFKCPYILPVVFGYCKGRPIRVLAGKTHHTLSNGSLCIGSTPVDTFWAHGDFNALNAFSFAASTIDMYHTSNLNELESIHWADMLKASTIVNIVEGDGSWT